MKTVRKAKILSLVAAVFAVLMLAAPGYSWTGQHNRGHGGYDNHGYYNDQNYSHRQYGHRYHQGYRPYGHGNWGGYYRASHRPHFYPVPFSLVLPGFSFYIGP